ncbi:MAG: HAD family phosphatase [Thermoprotei archaeon]
MNGLASRIKGVTVDLDGTLVDTVNLHVECWVNAFMSNGYKIDPVNVEPLVGMATPKLIKTLIGNVNDQILERIDLEHKSLFMEKMSQVSAFSDAKPALELLHKEGMKIAVASSTRYKMAETILEKTGLAQFVDSIVGGDEVLMGKPDPEIYIEAFKRLDVSPRMGAVVGDTEYDAIPARKIGALAIVVRRDGNSVNQADLLMSNLLDVAAELLNA